MSKLSIFDIVALAKAGYKAADIDKLTSVDIPEDGEDQEQQQTKAPAESLEQPPAENPGKTAGKDKEGSEDKEDDIDYKKLYEDKCAELEKAQQKNTHQNQSNVTDKNTPTIEDIVRSFM